MDEIKIPTFRNCFFIENDNQFLGQAAMIQFREYTRDLMSRGEIRNWINFGKRTDGRIIKKVVAAQDFIVPQYINF